MTTRREAVGGVRRRVDDRAHRFGADGNLGKELSMSFGIGQRLGQQLDQGLDRLKSRCLHVAGRCRVVIGNLGARSHVVRQPARGLIGGLLIHLGAALAFLAVLLVFHSLFKNWLDSRETAVLASPFVSSSPVQMIWTWANWNILSLLALVCAAVAFAFRRHHALLILVAASVTLLVDTGNLLSNMRATSDTKASLAAPVVPNPSKPNKSRDRESTLPVLQATLKPTEVPVEPSRHLTSVASALREMSIGETVDNRAYPGQQQLNDLVTADSVGPTPDESPLVVSVGTIHGINQAKLSVDVSMDVIDDEQVLASSFIAGAPSDHYTLQLFVSQDVTAVESFIREHDLNGALFYAHHLDDRVVYKVIFGHYADPEAARAALQDVAPGLNRQTPWVRRIGVLQAEVGLCSHSSRRGACSQPG